MKYPSLLLLFLHIASGSAHNTLERVKGITLLPWSRKTANVGHSNTRNVRASPDLLADATLLDSQRKSKQVDTGLQGNVLKRRRSSLKQHAEYVSVKLKRAPESINTTPNTRSSSKDVGDASVSKEIWPTLTGTEFNDYENINKLSETGVELCKEATYPNLEWKPDKKTEEILKEYGENGSASLTNALRNNLPSDTILVWTAKFAPAANAYGSELPIIKTRGIVPDMSPRGIASLLMDSSRVKSYNKMSLGREDAVVFQEGIDTIEGDFGDGESKIVVNLTKPPLVKKLMEFRTMMHARRLRSSECSGDDGYIMVSRAVTPSEDENEIDGDENGNLRSEILIGANLLRTVPDRPRSTDLTSVTHVNSPLVHPMVAKKVGMKGAIDFFNDLRSMHDK